MEETNLLEEVLNEISWSGSSPQTETQEPQNTVSEGSIPENRSIIIEETTSRFSSAEWFDEVCNSRITLGGAGGIGSWFGVLVSRLKPASLIVYDPDTVEAANLSGQCYGYGSVGQYKTQALHNLMKSMSNYYGATGINGEFNEESQYTSPIMVGAFDNMTARREFYHKWKHIYKDNPNALFIDGRLAAEEFQIFSIKGKDIYHMHLYEDKFLFSDSEAEETLCSYKQTSHCAAMIASVMINILTNFMANRLDTVIERPVPFFTSYDCVRMFLKTSDML